MRLGLEDVILRQVACWLQPELLAAPLGQACPAVDRRSRAAFDELLDYIRAHNGALAAGRPSCLDPGGCPGLRIPADQSIQHGFQTTLWPLPLPGEESQPGVMQGLLIGLLGCSLFPSVHALSLSQGEAQIRGEHNLLTQTGQTRSDRVVGYWRSSSGAELTLAYTGYPETLMIQVYLSAKGAQPNLLYTATWISDSQFVYVDSEGSTITAQVHASVRRITVRSADGWSSRLEHVSLSTTGPRRWYDRYPSWGNSAAVGSEDFA